jgi:hypothetical protein
LSTVIDTPPQGFDPSQLAAKVAREFGAEVLFELCDREIFLAESTGDATDLFYWRRVRAEGGRLCASVAPIFQGPAIVAAPEEGTKLVSVFSRISDSQGRAALFDLAVRFLRKVPLGRPSD